MNRGARRLPIFGDDHDRDAFLGLLADTVDRFGVEVHAYALMDNHFHLLIRADVRHLAAAMQLVTSGHAQRHNARYGLDGPLFRGRYRSEPITDERYLRHAVRYIHRNPIAGSTRETGPTAPTALRWTSHPAYLGVVDPPRWLHTDTVLRLGFGGDLDAYHRFVDATIVDHPYTPPTVPAETTPRPFTATAVEFALGVRSAPERALLAIGGRGVRNDHRLACVLLCAELAGCDLAEIQRRYGFASPSTLRSALSRARTLEADDPAFARLVDDARLRLRAGREAA